MIIQLPTFITHKIRKSFPDVIFACAWCPQEKHKPLKQNQAYTHGMCEYHKKEFIKSARERVFQMRHVARTGLINF